MSRGRDGIVEYPHGCDGRRIVADGVEFGEQYIRATPVCNGHRTALLLSVAYRAWVEPELRHARTTEGVDIAWGSVGRGHALIHLPGVPFSNFTAEWQSPVLRSDFGG